MKNSAKFMLIFNFKPRVFFSHATSNSAYDVRDDTTYYHETGNTTTCLQNQKINSYNNTIIIDQSTKKYIIIFSMQPCIL